jgi:hypothetical protein
MTSHSTRFLSKAALPLFACAGIAAWVGLQPGLYAQTGAAWIYPNIPF